MLPKPQPCGQSREFPRDCGPLRLRLRLRLRLGELAPPLRAAPPSLLLPPLLLCASSSLPPGLTAPLTLAGPLPALAAARRAGGLSLGLRARFRRLPPRLRLRERVRGRRLDGLVMRA